MKLEDLKKQDPEVYKIIKSEERRQKEEIELIASENYASKVVLKAMATILNNRYSEGYPGARYYGSQEFIDQIENLAIKRAKELFLAKKDFGKWHVNVQPYSGSPANLAIYLALAKVGDKIMGMTLSSGGHLSHGTKVSFTGKLFKPVYYDVDKKTEFIDYSEVLRIAEHEKPKIIICGYTAYPRVIDFKKFSQIAKKVGAYLVADISHIAGLVAAGVHPSPFAYADVVMTTTHKSLRGPRGAVIFCKKELAFQIDKAIFPGLQGGPHEHVIAAEAVCFKEAKNVAFKKYAKQIVKNAKVLAKELSKYGFRVVSGGTDNHLILIDLVNKNITGRQAEELLDEIGITCNKNMIPYDKRTPFDPSGIRIGTPAVTTRGMKEVEMKKIASWIDKTIKNKDNKVFLAKLKQEVKKFCLRYPVPEAE